MKGLNKFSQGLVEYMSALEWEYGQDALLRARERAEQDLFELFLSKGYSTVEARKLAIHVCEALEEVD